METIAISESTSLIVIKKSPQTFFSFTYGDAKVCFICGRCKLDGYTMGRGETVPISCGFGSYQVTVYIDEYANFSSNESLHQVLAEAQVPEAACDKITDYLKNDRGRREFLEQCIIVKLDKWKWPLLASLKRLIKPERFNTNCWFDVTFENIKSPIIQWSQVISDIVENIKEFTPSSNDSSSISNPKILVCGGQDSGKSSLVRHLVNQFLGTVSKNVYIIDCDPGQVEFTSPGLISCIEVVEPITCPPFVTCLRFSQSAITSYSIGSVSVAENPDLYLINFLYLWKNFISQVDPSSPIIINTMGWTQGIGVLLLSDIIRTIQPTHLIEIKKQPFDGRVNFPFDCTSEIISCTNGWSNLAKNNNQSYRSALASIPGTVNYSYITLSDFFKHHHGRFRPNRQNRINSQLAYLCRMDEMVFKTISDVKSIELNTKHLFFHIENEFPVEVHLIHDILRNSWVHLCHIDNPEAKPLKYSGLKVLKSLGQNICLGCAVVRFVDINRETITLLTPESLKRLKEVNCIVRPQGMVVPCQIY